MVSRKARNPANLFQQYTMPATKAATAVMTMPMGLALSATFSNHCTPSHTFVTAETTLIAPTIPHKAIVWRLKAIVPTPTTTARYPSSVFHCMMKLMTPATTDSIFDNAVAIGGTMAINTSMSPLTIGFSCSNMSTADCLILPIRVENLPLTVWLSLSDIPSKAPPALVAWFMAAATASKPICPLLIMSCSSA